MARLPRPYVPLHVRLAVAERMCRERGVDINGYHWPSNTAKLWHLLVLAGFKSWGRVHLDHDPALQNRQKLYHNGVHVAYSPPANDPDHLVYREVAEHRIKTLVRGDGAQHSDAALARKNKRIARNRDKTRKKFNWPKRKMRRA